MDENISPTGVYRDAKGRDIYKKTRAPYYVLVIFMMIYLLGFLASLVLVQNAYVPHTHTYQNNNGPLYSERYNSMYWYALMFSACRMFLFITVCSVILYRNTSCCCGPPENRGCGYFWAIFLVMWVVIDVCVMAIFASFFHGCNVPGNAGNPCNDIRYCHVPEVYNNPSSGCTYMTAWNPPVVLGELTRNTDFVWIFSVSVVFVAFDLLFLLWPLLQWIFNTTGSAQQQETSSDFDVFDEDEDDEDNETLKSKIRMLPNGSMAKKRRIPKKK